MSVTKAFKVYGQKIRNVQHRCKESFEPSYKYDFSSDYDGTRIIEVICADLTHTNDYVIVRITRDNEEDCYDEIDGQWKDGIFENQRVERPVEINIDETIKYVVNEERR